MKLTSLQYTIQDQISFKLTDPVLNTVQLQARRILDVQVHQGIQKQVLHQVRRQVWKQVCYEVK